MDAITPIDRSSTDANVITLEHCYAGQVLTDGRRLADILSNPNLAIVEMRHTCVKSAGPEPVEISCNELLVAKKDILMVVPQGRHEAPIHRANNYQAKRSYDVVVTLPGYVLTAVAHLPDRASARMLIDDSAGLPAFFGLTSVTVAGSSLGFVPANCDTVIVNRRQVEAVELRPQPLVIPQPEQAETAG